LALGGDLPREARARYEPPGSDHVDAVFTDLEDVCDLDREPRNVEQRGSRSTSNDQVHIAGAGVGAARAAAEDANVGEPAGSGRWRVVTQTSAHYLDLGARTVTRIEGVGATNDDAGFTVSAMRLDREITPLLELVRCEVGYPMALLIQVTTRVIAAS